MCLVFFYHMYILYCTWACEGGLSWGVKWGVGKEGLPVREAQQLPAKVDLRKREMERERDN